MILPAFLICFRDSSNLQFRLPHRKLGRSSGWVSIFGYLVCLTHTLKKKKSFPKGERKVLILGDNWCIKKFSPSHSLPGPLLSSPGHLLSLQHPVPPFAHGAQAVLPSFCPWHTAHLALLYPILGILFHTSLVPMGSNLFYFKKVFPAQLAKWLLTINLCHITHLFTPELLSKPGLLCDLFIC